MALNLIHIRFTEELKDWFLTTVFNDVSRGVVAQETGTQQEGIHYHAIFETKLTPATFKKRCCEKCKEMGLTVARGKGNAYYGACKLWSPDMAYACKQGNVLLHPGVSDEELATLIALGKERHSHKVASDTKPVASAEERLIRFCETEFGWKRGEQFPLEVDEDHWASSFGSPTTPRHHNLTLYGPVVRRAVIRYARGRVYRNQTLAMSRNILYVFATPQLRLALEEWFDYALEM